MLKRKIFQILLAFAGIIFFLAFPRNILASEGTAEVVSTTPDKTYRCFVASLRMQNLEYKILFSCRDLIYPADENIFNYVLWAQPIDGDRPIRLGTLGLGKGELGTKTSFTSLFVTIEESPNPRNPSDRVVMRGNVKPVEILREEKFQTPTPSLEEIRKTEEEATKAKTPEKLSTRQKLSLALRRAGVAALLASVAIIGLIFVITRSRS